MAVSALSNHWWWRPGWRVGRRLYACHVTFPEPGPLHDLVRDLQAPLRDFGELDLIPERWLHLTLQGIAFTDELSEAETRAIRDALIAVLAARRPPVVRFHLPTVRPEAIYLTAEPVEPLRAVRRAVRGAIASVVGRHRVPGSESDVVTYRPHVNIAYSAAKQAAAPIREALAAVAPEPVEVTIGALHLLEYHRDHRMYQWTSATPVPLGGSAGPSGRAVVG